MDVNVEEQQLQRSHEANQSLVEETKSSGGFIKEETVSINLFDKLS